MPLDVSRLKPGDVVYLEVEFDTDPPGPHLAVDTAAVVVGGGEAGLYAVYLRPARLDDYAPHTKKVSAFDLAGWAAYATQSEAVRAAVRGERAHEARCAARCAAAEALAARLEAEGR